MVLERNSRAARLFEVRVEVDAPGLPGTALDEGESWREWARRMEGCYLLRSNVIDWTPEELWHPTCNSRKPKLPFACTSRT